MADIHELADLKSGSAVQSAAYVDIETSSSRDKDREALARLGKEQILTVGKPLWAARGIIVHLC